MTYSIVARDPVTGELGVAVQSGTFGAGAVVPWARPGVGAVATQAIAEAAYGPRCLDALAAGSSATQRLTRRQPPMPSASSARSASSPPTARWQPSPAKAASIMPATCLATASRCRRT